MEAPRHPSVLFAEPDPSFVQMAAVLSSTYAKSMGPSSGGHLMWPRIDLPNGATNDDLVTELRSEYVGEGLDPEIRFADDEDEMIAAAQDADVLVTERRTIDAAVLEKLGPRLRFIQRFGAWVPSVDIEAAAERGVLVANWRRSANRRVAEHVVMLMLALSRQLLVADRSVRAFDPNAAGSDEDGRLQTSYTNNWVGLQGMARLEGKSLGIIGLGEVGSEVASFASRFGMRITYTQRHRNERAEA